MKKDNRVKTSLSKSQWKKIEALLGVNPQNKDAIRLHITRELLRIDNVCIEVETVEECVNCQEERRFGLASKSWESIERIKKKTGIKDPATIISKFILTPLLLQEKKSHTN